ncbi:MAG: F0F1 ATP synthase subunit A, partial [Bacteroidetes bacterium]|nr:F0F1 ATP synthase subunit A [Bacteroidota bacterium]
MKVSETVRFFCKILNVSLLIVLLLGATAPRTTAASAEGEPFSAGDMILHHISDAHEWHFWDGPFGTLYLPVIAYSSDKGLDVFMSSKFYNENHEPVSYNGYRVEHGHLERLDGGAVTDFSITKNVAMLFLNAALLLIVFLAVARGYKRNEGKAPKGIQSFFEPIIIFIRDEVIKPNIGKGYEK